MESKDDRKQECEPATLKTKQQNTNKKTRRGYGNKNKRKSIKGIKNVPFSIIGTNSNGILGKKESLDSLLNKFHPSVITLQETKLGKTGMIKMQGYQIFEQVRKENKGGGLLTAVDHDLQPVLVSTGGEDTESEVLTVQVKVNTKDIRIINAYGPQEDDSKENIIDFWSEIEREIIKAKDNNCLIVIQMDANAKVGKEVIKNDPHETSNNGKILLEMVERNNLTIANSLSKCNGVITRDRKTVTNDEKSVIDYLIICEEMEEYLEEMIIDDDRTMVLTKYNKKGMKTSDHNVMIGHFNLKFDRKVFGKRIELFNFKNKDNQEAFKIETSISNNLSASFSNERSFSHNATVFLKNLKSTFHKCFQKVRITSNIKKEYGDKTMQGLLQQKIELKQILLNSKSLNESKLVVKKLEEIESLLTDKFAFKSAQIIKEQIDELRQTNGGFSQLGFWKIKKKFFPNATDPPMAKKNESGQLITAPDLLKNLYFKTYKQRLRERPMKPEFLDIFMLKTELWESRLRELSAKKSDPWTIEELKETLKSLKNNKSRDPLGMINELFKENCAGPDLILALLKLMNEIKHRQSVPDFMNLSNITTLYKHKGSRLDMNSDRGIFILTSMKRILDKMIYLEKFDFIDKNMSDSNIGSRKDRNIKNHLFMIYGIINSVVKGKEECVDIQIYDIEKAFDALWLADCFNDMYDSLPSNQLDDKISLLYESNKNNLVAVKTAVGMTDRMKLPYLVQQGGTWGPGLCSNTVDTLGKKCRDQNQHVYMYKKRSKVLIFAMCDDINGVAKCGLESVALNAFITSQIELKKLKFHTPDKDGKSKCHKLHVGKMHANCPQLKVHGTTMEDVSYDTYLGEIISADGKNTRNIRKRISRGLGAINQIMNLVSLINLGEYYFDIVVLLRESLFLNSILTNAEIWYNITKEELKELEDLDVTLLRKIFNAQRSTPKEAYYLELGILSIGTIIKKRRLNYFHYLITRDKNEMLYSFFITQFHNPCQGDWTEQAKLDFEDFGIDLDIETLQRKSKESFKTDTKLKAAEYELERLLVIKEKHTKMQNLSYTELKMQGYLKMKGMSKDIAQSLFKWRVRMAPFGQNFRGGQMSIICPICNNHVDCQSLIGSCKVLMNEIDTRFEIEDIYKEQIDLETGRKVIKIEEARKKIIELKSLPSGPSARLIASAAVIIA